MLTDNTGIEKILGEFFLWFFDAVVMLCKREGGINEGNVFYFLYVSVHHIGAFG